METISGDGSVRPNAGTLSIYEAPNGPGVRTDGFGYTGYKTSTAFDSLLAKVIVHSGSKEFSAAVARMRRALAEFRITGVETNIPFLLNVLDHADFVGSRIDTRWVDNNVVELAKEHANSRVRFIQVDAPGEGQEDLSLIHI